MTADVWSYWSRMETQILWNQAYLRWFNFFGIDLAWCNLKFNLPLVTDNYIPWILKVCLEVCKEMTQLHYQGI